ncbi:MAG TPA: sigma-54 dependent transcriptional regulator, partial [Pyrinomonadaceae bacterium]|nr:sigma-54 dependent transcriptional regulator [Pyrinomonadaceae bacterium]
MIAQPRKKILVVDDEPSVTGSLELILSDAGYEVVTAHSVADATGILKETTVDLVITDLRLSDATGIDLTMHIKRTTPEVEVILMTAYGSIDVTIEAIKAGAYYYLEKPYTPDRLFALVDRALQLAALRHENESLKRTLAGDSETFGMIGRDLKMCQIFETIRTAAPSDASVLIEGESGTGKELIATAFHTQSQRAAGPFIRINCAAIPHELIESELFGYKKGAFTGADRDKRGLIEAANQGTLLLDEIAEMPTHLQTKLLRVLQERKLRRLGDEREITVNFRLVSATNRNTQALLDEGLLRKDLYFRISTIKLRVPPLRERLDDVPLIAGRFLKRFNEQYGKRIYDLAPETVMRLVRYDWPGNIRQLESVIERAVLFCPGPELQPNCLPEEFQTRATSSSFIIPPLLAMEEIEREAIMQTLERTAGNVKKSAQILRFPRPTFYRKLKKLGIKVERPDS